VAVFPTAANRMFKQLAKPPPCLAGSQKALLTDVDFERCLHLAQTPPVGVRFCIFLEVI
jgi:hypothetical protein